MTPQPPPPEGRRQRRLGGRGGCWRVLVGLLVAVGAAGAFLLRWLWLLARRERPSESEAEAIREAPLVPEEAEARREQEGLRRIDLLVGALVGGVALLGLAFILLTIWGVPDWLTGISLTRWRDEPEALWLGMARNEALDDAQQTARRATESARRDGYGWQDEEAGVARIPVERAMALLLERGESLAKATLPSSATATPEAVGTPTATVTVTATATVTATVTPEAGSAVAGEELSLSLGCEECHIPDGSGAGPSLVDLYGSQVELESGETVDADEEYLRRSILQPNEQIVDGYQPIMPSFEGELSEQELQDLVAYIRSLSDEEP